MIRRPSLLDPLYIYYGSVTHNDAAAFRKRQEKRRRAAQPAPLPKNVTALPVKAKGNVA